MIKINNYKTISEIYKSSNSVIYKGLDEKDGKSVVIKILNKEYPTPEDLKSFQYEFDILNDLKIEGVVKNYEIVDYRNSKAIIMEDFGGESRLYYDKN
ncbi:MAG: hypothetical protein A2086_10935 [Spirochaetes bacterium GWD1_27_9]|nr:MAG: hypothetical protein A2Z98_08225 [Spirochaetes bacterium GWB1_27_13]OHD27756.1 MAG: hypothetical protein A2Y34_08955 [Spirochaetes bacterium GWC1_27_15]OHD45442.1 MAG: hypothetical protein A2086_10935 [Spirochaetes bacterium GWD1_27_9]